MKMMEFVRIGAVLLLSTLASHADIPADQPLPIPTCGFNLGNTLEATWELPNWSGAIFTNAANAGFNAVRIPCAWDFNFTTNDSVFFRLIYP